MMQDESCDLKIHINGQQTFFLNQRIVCTFSGKLRKMVKHERKRSQMVGCLELQITDFPTNPDGFELVARFCYNDGRIPINPSNASLLHFSATFLEMTEEFSTCNLLSQSESFLDGIFYWTWNDIITSLKSCEPFFSSAESSGLLHNLISALLVKISCNSEIPLAAAATATPPLASPSSFSSSSPDTCGFRSSSSTKTPDTVKPCLSREWWFDDLTLLHPHTVEKIVVALGAYGAENKNLIITRFLLHYLKAAAQREGGVGKGCSRTEYGGLADTAVHGVVVMGRGAFSCRGLFWVLRVVSGLGVSRDCRHKLERVMGLMVDQVSLDDLLVCGHEDGGVYDVSLVMRLVRVFVGGAVSVQRMKKLGRLMDKYLREVAPDHTLKVSKFLGLAESLPDSARDCFDGVYRALDIYLQSHPTLSFEDKSRLCRCLNYEKLTLEACKDLAKNPRIPPRAAVQALSSQQAKLQPRMAMAHDIISLPSPTEGMHQHKEVWEHEGDLSSPSGFSDDKEELRLNLQRMQWRVVELEKVCREMKGQMSKIVRNKAISSSSSSHHTTKGLPRLC